MSRESIDPTDIESYDHADDQAVRDRDGVASLRDTEAEAGDEDETDDSYDLDQDEAREIGVNLDRTGGETPRLD
ncbi:MAG TPA: hypothetical protein VHV79_05835 [Mycobacteriales bacterium]|jgi:hypothetical protein|nr:hypothetical protein [Mycobacteriales bacterium]